MKAPHEEKWKNLGISINVTQHPLTWILKPEAEQTPQERENEDLHYVSCRCGFMHMHTP